MGQASAKLYSQQKLSAINHTLKETEKDVKNM